MVRKIKLLQLASHPNNDGKSASQVWLRLELKTKLLFFTYARTRIRIRLP